MVGPRAFSPIDMRSGRPIFALSGVPGYDRYIQAGAEFSTLAFG